MGLFSRKKPQAVHWSEVIEIAEGQTRASRKELIAELDKLQAASPELFADIKKNLDKHKRGKIDVTLSDIGKDHQLLNHLEHGIDGGMVTFSGHQTSVIVAKKHVEDLAYNSKGKICDFSVTQVLAHELSRVADKDFYPSHKFNAKREDKNIAFFAEFKEYAEKRGVKIDAYPEDGAYFVDKAVQVFIENPSLRRGFCLKNPIQYADVMLTQWRGENIRERADKHAIERSNEITAAIRPDFEPRSDYKTVYGIKKALPVTEEDLRAATKLAKSSGQLAQSENVEKPQTFEIRKAVAVGKN